MILSVALRDDRLQMIADITHRGSCGFIAELRGGLAACALGTAVSQAILTFPIRVRDAISFSPFPPPGGSREAPIVGTASRFSKDIQSLRRRRAVGLPDEVWP